MQKIRNKGYNNMRKVIIFLLVFTIGLVSFSLESKETLLKLIEEVEKEPVAEKIIEKYERIIRFSIESDDVQVMLFPEIISFDEKNTEEKYQIMLIGSYNAGAIRAQLIAGEPFIQGKEALEWEFRTYKLLRSSKNIRSDFFETMLEAEKAGKLEDLYNEYLNMIISTYHLKSGAIKDRDIIVDTLDLPAYITVDGKKILITAIAAASPRSKPDMTVEISIMAVDNLQIKDKQKLAENIIKKILENKEIKEIYMKDMYSKISVAFIAPKRNISEKEIYTIFENMYKKNIPLDLGQEFSFTNTVSFDKNEMNLQQSD